MSKEKQNIKRKKVKILENKVKKVIERIHEKANIENRQKILQTIKVPEE